MTKPWDLVEDEARRLYSDGMSLKRLQSELSHRHGFKASTRAWRNKIDQWGIKKHRPKENLARSVCLSCGAQASQRQPGFSMPVERPSTGQDAREDQTMLDDNHDRSSDWNDELNGSSEDSSGRTPRHGELSTAVRDGTPSTRNNTISIEPSAGLLLERVSNEDIYGRLSFSIKRRTERAPYPGWEPPRTDEECESILDEATFINGEDSILHFAARQGGSYYSGLNLDCLVSYMRRNGHSLKLLDGAGQTALEVGIKADNYEAIRVLCRADPSVANVDHRDGSLLHVAIRYSEFHLCNLLLKHVQDNNRKDRTGMTPLELAARYGHGRLVEKLLDNGARVHDHRALVDSILCSQLDTHSGCDLLERGMLKHKEPHEINSTCYDIVRTAFEGFAEFLSIAGPGDYRHIRRLIRLFSLLEHVCRMHPASLSVGDGDKDLLFEDFLVAVDWACRHDLELNIIAIDRYLRLLLRKGCQVRTDGCFPYTDTLFEEHNGFVSYIYVRACVETCNIETYGQGLFRLLERFLGNEADSDDGADHEDHEDEFTLWSTSGVPKLLDLLQTLLDRGLQSPQGINLLSFVLEKVPNTCMEQKLRLLRTVVMIQRHSPIDECEEYGQPLDLLAQTPEPSCWRYAEVLLSEDALNRLLESHSPIEQLESIASPDSVWMSTFSTYTTYSHELRRCVLHVLTRTALDNFSVDFQFRLGKVLHIRWSYGLPDLQFRMTNVGLLSLIEDDKATTTTNEATEPVDSAEIIGHSS